MVTTPCDGEPVCSRSGERVSVRTNQAAPPSALSMPIRHSKPPNGVRFCSGARRGPREPQGIYCAWAEASGLDLGKRRLGRVTGLAVQFHSTHAIGESLRRAPRCHVELAVVFEESEPRTEFGVQGIR